MLPAVVWEESEDHPGLRRSVEGRLRERVGVSRADAERHAARRAADRSGEHSHLIVAGDGSNLGRDYFDPDGKLTYSAVVFVFAPPDSAPARQLIRRRAYFDERTGDTWDVFFPGYFQYGSMNDPGQIRFDDYWGFSPRAFDQFRRDLECRVDGRWRYSGGSDLVILNMATYGRGPVTIDYDSVLSGPLTDPDDDTRTLTLARVIELISADIEGDRQDRSYGVGKVVDPLEAAIGDEMARRRSNLRETAIAGAGATLGAIGAHILGIGS